MGKIENLPKWAQHRIDKLERDVEFYQRKVREMAGEVEHETDTEIWSLDENIRLPVGSRIEFKLGDGNVVDAKVRKNELMLMATNGALSFIPSSSNCGKVRIVEW